MLKRTLTLVGGVLLVSGLAVAFMTNHFEEPATRRANRGVAGHALKEGSPEWEATVRMRTEIEWLFWTGLALTAGGVVLQTAGALLRD